MATPTEAFAALAEGADVLKMFPAEQMGPAVVKAWLAVLPAGTILAPVGGITPDNMQVFIDAGVKGFGLGSGLFKPGMTQRTWRSTPRPTWLPGKPFAKTVWRCERCL